MANIPSHVVHNQTATMLEIGTNLLTHTAEQTRKLNVVEAKVTAGGFWLCPVLRACLTLAPSSGAESNLSD